MRYTAADGEAGYPGKLTVCAAYRWSDACELELTLRAETDAPTVVNLPNHAYWNLSGHSAGSALDHTLMLAASRYLPTDSTLIPEGVLVPRGRLTHGLSPPPALCHDIKTEFRR